MPALRERLAVTVPGYRFSIGRTLIIYSGLMVTLLLAALDQTIVATALPRIASDLDGISQYAWVFTAYMLASTVTVPLFGKLGDVYGRKRLMLLAIVVFLTGSALCGLAQTMTQLVIFRAIQGVGAGGIIPLTFAVIGNLVPPRARGRWQGLIGSVFATASIAGPAAGGLIVDHFSWRWVFLVNLPIGAVALVVISMTMASRAHEAEHSIDWLGAGLLASGTAAFLLGLVWGGRDYGWTSGQVLGAFAAAVLLLGALAVVERRAVEPILPFDVVRNPVVASSIACMALVGMLMFASISYVPLFVQAVIGTTATSSGAVLAPLMLSTVATSIVTGQLISRTGRYRWNAVLGPLVLATGMFLLSRMDIHTTTGEATRNMIVTGIGTGSMMQVFMLSVQNVAPAGRIGSATALTQFSRQIGSTLGVALIGAIVNHGLPRNLEIGESRTVRQLPLHVRTALAHSIHIAFLAAACIALLVWLIALLGVKEVPLRQTIDEQPAAQPS